ncbi:hypothetical protein GCM10023093_19030 [Nemorincola caseinilytica]|uniref:Uncharacterized protein n=2 Tax=Nemorincola caseinilytica TaxID=2054315 RepID=A0ABP8NEE2_9BACT
MRKSNYLSAIYIWLIASIAIVACGPAAQDNIPAARDTAIAIADTMRVTDEVYDTDTEYETLYIVVADTAKDYYILQRSMYALHKATGIVVDTMRRHYDEQKNKIVLAEDDEDEMYRGDYYPRRTAGTSLSLEYYSLYDNTGTTEDNIALVAGQYETRASADSLRALIAPHAPKIFVREAQMYTGCMH